MNTMDDAQKRLNEFRKRHREVDKKIGQLNENPTTDQLEIQRLKKQKLALKDEISRIEVS